MIKQKKFFREYFNTILEVIETQSTFLIPYQAYCVMVVILFMQISGYIFSTYEVKPLYER